jgi:hypothetical protein
MNVVTKIINSIRSVSLKHRPFKALLEGVESEHSDLILHTEVRWLSMGKVVSRFLELIPQIRPPKSNLCRPRRGERATGSRGLPAGAKCGGNLVCPRTVTVAVKAQQEPWKLAEGALVRSSKLGGLGVGPTTPPCKIFKLWNRTDLSTADWRVCRTTSREQEQSWLIYRKLECALPIHSRSTEDVARPA